MNPTGDTVIFERTPVPDHGAPTTLQMIDDLGSPNPVPFLSGSSLPASQTRPDWCWATGDVLFNGATSNSAPVSVWQVGSNGANPTPIDGTTDAILSTKWGLEGHRVRHREQQPRGGSQTLATRSSISRASRLPGTSTARFRQDVIRPSVRHAFRVWQAACSTICYAGEPAIPNWTGPIRDPVQRKQHYIFLTSRRRTVSPPCRWRVRLGQRVRSQLRGRRPRFPPTAQRSSSSQSSERRQTYTIYLFSRKYGSVKQVTKSGLTPSTPSSFPAAPS